jgi:pimeloyl-ACP methyl ester carboxylesterase
VDNLPMMIETNGMSLYYEGHGAEEGEPLLWLHGAMGVGADWRHVFGTPPAGHRLLAPDLRGHGQSTGAGPTYSFKQSALDMFALLEDLAIDSVRIIGLSGGGITALHMATLQPARVSAMVVVSAPPAFPPQARAMQRLFSAAALPEGELAQMRVRHQRPGQLAALFAQVQAMAEGDDPNFSTDALTRISADTLIVFGDRDPLYPARLSITLREAIPHSWLWVVPNGGHGPIFGPHAPVFTRTALDFFAGAYRSAS